MPIIVELTYKGGQSEILRFPAEIWRRNSKTVTKLVITPKELVSVQLDPRWETADVDTSDNTFPRKVQPKRLDLFKRGGARQNLMQRLDFKVEPGDLQAIRIEDEDEEESNADNDE